jgi:hypothetical protein
MGPQLWLGRRSEAAIAALALTGVRTGMERWASQESPGDEDDSPVPYV